MVSPTFSHWIGQFLALLAAAAVVYQLVVVRAFGRWFARPCPEDRGDAAVTLLKPLHGAEPKLAENLATFLVQDHAGPVQMLCGVNAPDDAALAVARGLQPARAQDEVTLWPGPRAAGANGKIGNLVAMMGAARHPLLVLSDSDMAVAPDYLPKVLGALQQPGIGVVSCLYLGRGDAGRWSEIGAAAISYAMMPNMTLALRYGLSQPCMGSTIALRRETLDAIGGFERFVDVLADDYAIGMAVSALGLRVAVPPMLVTHACEEPSLAALWRHHLRWAATLRSIVGLQHGGTVITHALPLAVLAALFAPLPGLLLVAAALAARLMVKRRVDRQAGHASGSVLDLVLSDFLGFFVFLASLTARTIDWRGHRLTMHGDGRIRSRTAPAP
ncbi:MAG: bacteriohopanetetrol glucosamine biosynthesis glycosyltransferase HpnI [Sphingomonadales bacterium]|nr:bacteriohopanetetrol glucosamine biosynthesis glycosyltransferase HpnI [Sphingomonadales bacterium]